VTPPPREPVEPLRDIPGLPKKERTWRDEVQERVRKRRKKRAQSSLPLFEQPGVAEAPEEPRAGAAPVRPRPAPEAAPPSRRDALAESTNTAPYPPPEGEPPVVSGGEFEATPLSEEELADLPLRAAEPSPPLAGADERRGLSPVSVALPPDAPALDEQTNPSDVDDEEGLSLTPPPREPAPLERPARVGERAQAAAVDAGILVVLGALVVYFAGRAARVDVPSLVVSWPWLTSYLAFLGLFYAGYFTGTTGQTPGKMVAGLRVVDSRGRPPGYLRASLRALAGAAGTLLAGLGLIPMALDPARRALHDRLLRTRVIQR
jgi:uncharacterized RDD family membrane protein YckC